MAASSFHVLARREGRWWVVEIPALDIATQTRNLKDARAVATEAIGLYLDVDESKVIVDLSIQLPRDVSSTWQKARDLEEESRKTSAEAARLSRAAVRTLRASGMSQRDAAEALGLSYQRIAQLEKQSAST
ncbi:hypothetical protein M3B90_07970 [Dermabacter sp. p3-SID358]|uniref:hypothetical protein n=1 Tax=Dermabacter sp. p3-SID358 TaxID=2916114 RepID=UPI0021A52A6E|nr:hypothetical protein [Dermabacter sp. p3-SID358]MCT1867462.1 hypothetical protein [Dermabacter sp. p3-SID358]